MDNNEFHFFYRGVFSQWHRCSFQCDSGVVFNCTEQYMMYHKALLFKDLDTASKILKASVPSAQKQLGREVADFQEKTWIEFRQGIVFMGNYYKFTQNETLKEALLATGNLLLVEASKRDKIWGIGLSEDDERIFDRRNWRGLNLLGIALTRVREVIRWEERYAVE